MDPFDTGSAAARRTAGRVSGPRSRAVRTSSNRSVHVIKVRRKVIKSCSGSILTENANANTILAPKP
ncbi:hypothetical protein EVAR_7681_1 [Eumeta japonica]|uniref:Uncharacterized protein n=1 Tax=Eumeta variegata TaxID=151549 RepID=A0A4C1TKX5_EUMVA|nr:hypothetical protein EVAR_7681_1 [Eumeta japonica]